MGLCASISRGLQRVPCMQYMGSCRGLITASPGEIADHLRLGKEDIHLNLEVRRLLRRIDDYFNPYAEYQDLDTDEKRNTDSASSRKNCPGHHRNAGTAI